MIREFSEIFVLCGVARTKFICSENYCPIG